MNLALELAAQRRNGRAVVFEDTQVYGCSDCARASIRDLNTSSDSHQCPTTIVTFSVGYLTADYFEREIAPALDTLDD